MKPKFSTAYLDRLFSPGQYMNLVEISSLLCGSEVYESTKDDYGLTPHLFLLVESLSWFAHSRRSGAWTYFEVTPHARQALMFSLLEAEAPAGFAQQYSIGMQKWQDEAAMKQLDRWMEEHDVENNHWLWRLAEAQRASFLRMII